MDEVKEDLTKIGVIDLKNIIHDREKWREIVMAAKILVEQITPEERKVINYKNQVTKVY